MDSGGRRGSTGRDMGLFILIAVFIFIYSNKSKNFPLSNVSVAEMARGFPRNKEARQGYILRIHRKRDRKERGG